MRRRRSGDRRFSFRSVVVVAVVAGVAYGGYALTGSRLFALSGIDVVGASSPHDVIEASGLRVGQSMMHLDLSAIAARVESLPDVEDARVQREGSLRIRITVVERVAALAIAAGDRTWFVDAQGTPVARATRGALPVLHLPAADRDAGSWADTISSTLSLWDALPPSLRAHVTSFEPIADGLAFDLGSTRVVFGDVSDVAQKLAALDAVAARVAGAGKQLVEIDLRAPDHPAARLA